MRYNLGILGGGPAGYSAALEAKKNGLSVILFEKDLLGGTCLNRGCVPTKFLENVAELYDNRNILSKYGIIQSESSSMDFSLIQHEMKNQINRLRNNLEQLLSGNDVKIIKGIATLKSQNIICCETCEYEVDNILICTGSSCKGTWVEGAISSDELLEIPKIPKSMLILGGGVVAVEFANIFNKLGSEVTMVIRGERILKKWDKELAVGVTQLFKKNGIKICVKCDFSEIQQEKYQVVLSAVGRSPQRIGTNDFDLLEDECNAICIDEFGRTNYSNIYAAGDVVSGSHMLAHTAMEQGRNIVRVIAGKKRTSSAIVECIYLSPEVASIGFSEKEAKEMGIATVCGKVNMSSNARTNIATDDRCFIKLVVDKSTHQVIGAQLMCERASDIASELLVVINNGITVEKLKESVHPHPSFSEAIIDAVDAVLDKYEQI